MLIKPFPTTDIVHAIPIPFVGFPDLITANVYVLGNGPVTLIDTGPKIHGAVDFLNLELRRIGLDFEDIENIIVTHGHVDHFGLVASLRDRIGHPVKVFAHPEEKWRMSSSNLLADMWSQEIYELMVIAGASAEGIHSVKKRYHRISRLADPLDEFNFIENGDELKGKNFCLKVIHTSGHTSGSICLLEIYSKILFTGDSIIKHISPNPIVETNLKYLRNAKYRSLHSFIQSLNKLRALNVNFIYPGHGEYLTDLQAIIKSYIKHHQQRMNKILNVLEKYPMSICKVMEEVFPDMPEESIFLGVSEILSHLEVLIMNSKAKIVDFGPPVLYYAS
jgi:glyoxylase-like metal-dependent hydrolase (beta-lactamase superfamily II)